MERIALTVLLLFWSYRAVSCNTNRPYSYSARYQLLKPTFNNTLGGWDVFQQQHVDPDFVDCHMRKPKGEHEDDQKFKMEEMAKEKRCPELITKPPVEIQGRRTHIVYMLLAWVVLVPVAIFLTSFYRDSRFFFLQGFWWYAIHNLCLIIALLFSFGSIYAMHAYKIVWTTATKVHIYLGYGTLALFTFHLLVGAFRVLEAESRIIQIGLQWLFSWLEYLCAATVIMSAAAIPYGVMSCLTFGIYCVFLGYQLACQIAMELHLNRVDTELQLDPPRAYMPPQTMRFFHRDAQHSRFRMAMVGVFTTGCILFYMALYLSINWEGGECSCFQPKEITS